MLLAPAPIVFALHKRPELGIFLRINHPLHPRINLPPSLFFIEETLSGSFRPCVHGLHHLHYGLMFPTRATCKK